MVDLNLTEDHATEKDAILFQALETMATLRARIAALEAQLAERARVKTLEPSHATGNLSGQEALNSKDTWIFWMVKNPGSSFIWCESFGLKDHRISTGSNPDGKIMTVDYRWV